MQHWLLISEMLQLKPHRLANLYGNIILFRRSCDQNFNPFWVERADRRIRTRIDKAGSRQTDRQTNRHPLSFFSVFRETAKLFPFFLSSSLSFFLSLRLLVSISSFFFSPGSFGPKLKGRAREKFVSGKKAVVWNWVLKRGGGERKWKWHWFCPFPFFLILRRREKL